MANPRITIETVLEKVKQSDISQLEKQLKQVSAASAKSHKELKKFFKETDVEGVVKTTEALGESTRQFRVHEAVVRITTRRMNTWREAMQLGGIVLKDFFTKVGFLNALMNVMISRFGTMIIIFAAFHKAQQIIRGVKEALLTFDTAMRKVASLVVPAVGTVADAMEQLEEKMVNFALSVGVSFEQLSDTMFFLASAGLNSAQILATFEAAQKLVIATAKDMSASMEENKKAVEILAGLFNVYGNTLTDFNNEQDRAIHIAGILFQAFKTQQILLTELAVGLSFAASQAKVSGISLEELVASIAVLNTSMVKGSKAGTSYANAIRDATRNAGKLRELFDIDIAGIGENFSLLETVVAGIHNRMRDTGLDIRLLTDLMEVFNIRGLRSMVVLADQIDVTRNLMSEMKDGVNNLNDAVEIVTKSYKLQRQRLENIMVVLGRIFNIAITGGETTRGFLETWNDLLEQNIKQFLKMASAVSLVTFTVLTLIRAIRLLRPNTEFISEFQKEALEALEQFFQRQEGDLTKLKKEISDVGGTFVNVFKRIGSEGPLQKGTLDEFLESTKGSFKEVKKLFIEAWLDTGTKSVKSYVDIFESEHSKVIRAIQGMIISAEGFAASLKSSIPVLKNNLTLFRKISGVEFTLQPFPTVPPEAKQKILDAIQREVKRVEFAVKLTVPGDEVDFLIPPVVKTKEKLRTVLAELQTEHEIFADNIVAIMERSGEKGFAQALQKAFVADVDPTLEKQLESFSIMMSRRAQILTTEFRKEKVQFEDGSEELLDLQVKFALELEQIVQETFEGTRRITIKAFEKQTSDVQRVVTKSLDQLKNYLRDVNKQVAGIPLSKFRPSDIFTLSIEDIIPKFTDFERRLGLDKITIALEGIEGNWKEIVGRATQTAIDELEAKSKIFGTKRVKLFKQTREALKKEILLDLEETRKLINVGFQDRQADLLASLQQQVVALKTAQDDQFGILQKARKDINKLNADELRSLEEAVTKTGLAQDDAISRTINSIFALEQEQQRLLKLLDEGAIDEFLDGVADAENRLNAELEKGEIALSQTLKKYGDWNRVINESFIALQDLTFLIGNEFSEGVLDTIDALGVASDGIQQVIANIGELRAEMNKAKAAGQQFAFSLANLGSTLGIVQGVTGLIAGLVSIFRKPEDPEKSLAEEFLPEDATRRIAPDFGQARVVNQRITLTPIFQFLDASQLSLAAQRRLAETIFDEIQELQKAAG